MCLPFQYFIIPKACSVLTMSEESIAISLLMSATRHEKNTEKTIELIWEVEEKKTRKHFASKANNTESCKTFGINIPRSR